MNSNTIGDILGFLKDLHRVSQIPCKKDFFLIEEGGNNVSKI